MAIFLRKLSFIKNKDVEEATTTMIFVISVFLYSKDICICLVGQIDFDVSETCLPNNFFQDLRKLTIEDAIVNICLFQLLIRAKLPQHC